MKIINYCELHELHEGDIIFCDMSDKRSGEMSENSLARCRFVT